MIQQMIIDKEQFFSYPNTKRAIVDGRDLVEQLDNDLVTMLLELPQDKVILTDQPLIHYHQDPHKGYRHAQNFLKRGEEVYVQTPKTQAEAQRFQIGPGRRRLRSFENVAPDATKCGYVWRSMRDHRRRKVHLVDCLEGAKIFAFSHQSGNPDHKIKVKAYTQVQNVADVGGAYDCFVPSRSRDLQFSFVFHSVPLLNTKNQYSVWTHAHSSGHGGGQVGKDSDMRCGSKTYDPLNFRSVAGEEVFCPHEIAAYLEISRRAGKDTQGKILLQPFALPTPFTVDFYKKCRNVVLLRETRTSSMTRKEYKHTRPLNEAEIEVLLWQFTARQGYVATWYASEEKHGQKLRDYQWN